MFFFLVDINNYEVFWLSRKKQRSMEKFTVENIECRKLPIFCGFWVLETIYQVWYLILKDIEDWIASKDIQFFHCRIHLLQEK